MPDNYRRNHPPKIIISRCLGLAACRYDGQVVHNEFIEKLKEHVEFIPVCPEIEIGLPIPRPPLFLVSTGEQIKLIQPDTELDLTEQMNGFVRKFIKSLTGLEIKAVILKSRSPSCGLENVKVYSQNGKSLTLVSQNGTGFLAKTLQEQYADLPIENEIYFLNKQNRESFLRYLFTPRP